MATDRSRHLIFAVALLAVTALALWLRVPGLADKALHSDEGVNAWFSLRLHWWNVYRYQPTDYHGPFLYYVNGLLFWLLGPSDESLRLGTAVFGGLTPLLLWPLRRWLGGVGVLAGGLLIACAPAMVYFSRTVIHETYLIFFTLVWLAGLLHFLARPGLSAALVAAFGACGAFCNKETAVLTAGSLAAGLVLAWAWGRPSYDSVQGDRDLLGARGRSAALEAVFLRAWKAWLAGAALFFAGVVLLFSSFFTYSVGEELGRKMAPVPEWFVGVGAFFEAFVPWMEHGNSGRNQGKDWDYFWLLMQDTEGLTLPCALAAGLLALVLRHRFGLFLLGWGLSSFAFYSAIRYKTPWCVLNIDLPAFLLCAWGAGRCVAWGRDFGRHPLLRAAVVLLPLVLVLPVVSSAKTSLLDNRERFDDDAVEWVYVQTLRGFYDLLRDHFGVAAADPEADGLGPDVVNVNGKNPVRWYTITRGWDHGRSRYFSWKKTEDSLPSIKLLSESDIIVVVGPVKRRLGELVEQTGEDWHKESYPLRPGWKIGAWYRQDLWDRYQASGGRDAAPWPVPPAPDIHRPPKPRRFLRRSERTGASGG
jgi:uncharacterized protein (TIGR03663 family)